MSIPFQVDLSDKVVAITGAGGVICSEFARALAECGAKVALFAEIDGQTEHSSRCFQNGFLCHFRLLSLLHASKAQTTGEFVLDLIPYAVCPLGFVLFVI